MDNEELFLMLEEGIALASEQLTQGSALESFAMVLENDKNTRHISVDEMHSEARYEALLEVLRSEAEAENIIAIALLSNVTIPENFNAEVSTGIRIHVEEKQRPLQNTSSQNIHDKLSARLLYIPYQLFKTTTNETVQIQLHNPIPVSFACEIFK